MATLYELTNDWLMLMEMAEDPDIEEEVFIDTLEGLDGAIEDKADGYAKLIRQLEHNAEACDAESKRFAEKGKVFRHKADRMKKSLQGAMELMGKTKIKTPLFSFNIQNNPASVVVDVDIDKIPKKYLKPADPTVDKKLLKEDLKAGVELDGVAHLVQTRGLRIK